MYRFTSEAQQRGMARQQKKVLFSVIAVLFIIVVVLSVVLISKGSAANNSREIIHQRIYNCISEAQDSLNAISANVDSETASKVGNIKGYVFTIKQLNRVNMALNAQESLIDETILSQLETDLSQFDNLLRTSGSTITVRSSLGEHLEALKGSLK